MYIVHTKTTDCTNNNKKKPSVEYYIGRSWMYLFLSDDRFFFSSRDEFWSNTSITVSRIHQPIAQFSRFLIRLSCLEYGTGIEYNGTYIYIYFNVYVLFSKILWVKIWLNVALVWLFFVYLVGSGAIPVCRQPDLHVSLFF